MSDEADLVALFSNSEPACDAAESTTDFEPEFEALLEFIVSHPELRSEAVATLVAGVRNRTLGLELIEFLMHALRWPEVKEAVQDELTSATDWRIKTGMSGILEAFDDDGSGAVLYRRYRKSP